jgi:dCTP deaminase
MSVLNGTEIRRKMALTNYSEKLLITPLLDEGQIGPASVDIRLGSSLIIPKKTYVESQDVTSPRMARQVERRVYERLRLKYNTKFVLHPNELILGVTFEYISLPRDVFCTVASRSSWGRLGLVIATASAVQPGFRGSLTLELANLSDSPIALYPGLPVGQLVFYDVPSKGGMTTYEGRYDCPTEADLPGFYTKEMDRELTFWGESGAMSGGHTLD